MSLLSCEAEAAELGDAIEEAFVVGAFARAVVVEVAVVLLSEWSHDHCTLSPRAIWNMAGWKPAGDTPTVSVRGL
jgi:hypothetical protein